MKQGRLITGKDIINEFQLKGGKKVGAILKVIEDKQFYGEIKTRAEALAVVETLIYEQRK